MSDTTDAPLRKVYAPMVAVASVVLVLDQLTKWWATGLDECRTLLERPTVGFCLAHNEGMAFSFGWGRGAFIAVVALGIVITLFVVARKMPLHFRLLTGAIAGGALGNLVDRAFRAAADSTQHRGFMGGAVVDFIYTKFWPTFNIADSAVVVGGIVLAIIVWRLPDPDEESDAAIVESDTTAAPAASVVDPAGEAPGPDGDGGIAKLPT